MESALIALLSAVIGALLGHYLSERKSRNDELAKMRLDSYKDFITATSLLFSARRSGRTQDEAAELGALNDAKTRVCICASTKVVECLEEFWLQGGTLEKEQEILAFTRLCTAMRESLGPEKLKFDIKLSNVLFKLEPSTYSYKASREPR
ncbi:hypothetical protein [Pseudomonas sp. GOM6]|uniref:hypothetical protein n=1 Tax=Pseudomonas sp. GOM6 TaxID=3036944 RepID=UPI0024094962|nr:hypothetical protein [Pseudomonas sp. GOM6]MDG1581758.1 hypothetical protein [Pseudomonas sp. GOM6]